MVLGQNSVTLNPDLTTNNTDPHARPAPRLIVDLPAIQHNYRTLQSMASNSSVAVGAVVKANAYGLGAMEVLPALARAGCRTFYVAHTSEGEEARRALAGFDADIFVFNGFWPVEIPALRAANLFPVINDLAQVESLRLLAPDLPFGLHIDTGMARLGLGDAETEKLLARPQILDGLAPRQIMSHLACADDPEAPLNTLQRRRFQRVREQFPNIPASLSNSAGIMLGAQYHFDVLRPGLALFGGCPIPGQENPFKPTVRIEAPILQIRDIKPGDPIGYGSLFTATEHMQTATVAAGYADGLMIACGNRGFGRIGQVRTPILGRVSMDLISVDVSAVRGQVSPGDPVSFLGQDLETLARNAQTISYELLVRLGLRFHRVYLPARS
jgi:alanine racemase